MNYGICLSWRTLFLVSAICCMAMIVAGNVYAQEYEVKVKSVACGRAGEFPLQYTVEYATGELRDVTIDAEGTTTFTHDAALGDPVAIWWFGIRFVVATDLLCFHDNDGGCWCLCLKWVDWYPWQTISTYYWYYDPCCN